MHDVIRTVARRALAAAAVLAVVSVVSCGEPPSAPSAKATNDAGKMPAGKATGGVKRRGGYNVVAD